MTKKIYAIHNVFLKKMEMKEKLSRKQYYISNASKINITVLKKVHIKYLIMDFDGVLAKSNRAYLNEKTIIWIKFLSSKFNAKRIFILSNQPTIIREKYFLNLFPFIQFITAVDKKPNPGGILKVKKQMRCAYKTIGLVDDKILTGFLCSTTCSGYPIAVKNCYKRERFHLLDNLVKNIEYFLSKYFF